MPELKDIHGEVYPHKEPCPDLFCCVCDCHVCKRAWWAAGRPHPKDCPVHGTAAASAPQRRTIWERIMEGSGIPEDEP